MSTAYGIETPSVDQKTESVIRHSRGWISVR